MKAETIKKPYSQPKLTVHGDLRAITSTKRSTRRDVSGPRSGSQTAA